MLQRKLVRTADGSKTLRIDDWDEQYHSKHGAFQESKHVFIEQGLQQYSNRKALNILEMGFGTGLNALMTLMEGRSLDMAINYVSVEAYPIDAELVGQLEYWEFWEESLAKTAFFEMHTTPWEVAHLINPKFSLTKQQKDFAEVKEIAAFDLIYFDAFGARVQPELWTEELFATMFASLRPEGSLVTYSAKGSVRRALEKVGFRVERLPGPPGKREMLRGKKESSTF